MDFQMKKLSVSTTSRSYGSSLAEGNALKVLGQWFVQNEIELCMTICVLSFIAMIFLMSEFLFA